MVVKIEDGYVYYDGGLEATQAFWQKLLESGKREFEEDEIRSIIKSIDIKDAKESIEQEFHEMACDTDDDGDGVHKDSQRLWIDGVEHNVGYFLEYSEYDEILWIKILSIRKVN